MKKKVNFLEKNTIIWRFKLAIFLIRMYNEM